MGLTTSLYTGRTGLNANATALAITGNNIANVNTTAFKASRAQFETLISQTLSAGSPPTGDRGGSNPAQIGLGTRLVNSRDFTNGPIQPTGQSTDMAIEGNGFFIVNAGGEHRYTRAGNFTLDRDFNLVNRSGALVQGYSIDDNFNIQEGELGNVNIPLGAMTLAEATQSVRFSGNLNAGGEIATQGALISTQTIYADNAMGAFADDTTSLDQLFNAAGDPLFADGDLIQLKNVVKDGKTLPTRTFEVGNNNAHDADETGNTLGDLMNFLQRVLGIDDAISGGVSVTDGVINIEGNAGVANDLDFEPADLLVNPGAGVTSPLTFLKSQSANGESTRTSVVAYDSLGNEMTIDVTMVLEAKDNGGTQWRYYAQSSDHMDLDRRIGTGVMNFNTRGRLEEVSEQNILISRDGTGAVTPQPIQLLFDNGAESLSALADKESQISPLAQDGSPLGTLGDFMLADDGTIKGIFSNGLIRDLGRLPVAMFVNNEGLEEVGGNLFKQTANSGQASLVNAGTGGAGRTIGAALEQSNVDLANEFINLISATTGFSASSRVLTTSDRLLQELMTVVR